MGYVDTDMTTAVTAPKASPEDIAKQALDGIESGAHEVLADDTSRQAKAGVSQRPDCDLSATRQLIPTRGRQLSARTLRKLER